MMRKKNLLLLVVAILLCTSLGTYIGFYATSIFFLEANYSSIVSDMVYEITVLKSLRENKTQDAISLLESKVDANILMLHNEHEDISKARAEMIKNILNQASEYRSQYGIKNSDQDIEKTIQKILNSK